MSTSRNPIVRFKAWRRWRKQRKDYARRLDGIVPEQPMDWDEFVEHLPVIEI